ncbi:DUF72 domain-containing protein [Chryseobacterium wangxinyae]|uniref:DUF72 domain-containing protein n=1 Tax=Chryseobacterium sp. CY350 TaxID=2997336 RepID=UPI0022710EA3|nr:DUF72 domain-containing protein [Chryseobacterium sp. CY350]MCY0978317.1 DUF72 domain-containing protein [Chryseobacterium sp. CY350]WBZ96095.1 DUF72 domain-containing protein [Chryseobacterium sp. CY350]
MKEEKIYIGCSGFYNNDWKGSLYPEDAKSKDFLTLYSQQFNSVEINSTFYRKPTAKTLQKWFGETPDDFKFFIKIPKSISHEKRLENCKDEITIFCNYIKTHLEEKLAGFLYQFPPSFKNSDENLKRIFENIDLQFFNVIEFRHESWWNEEIFKILEQKNITFSGVSFPGNLPEDVIINSKNAVYYRLHGKPILYKSEYSEEFLNDLAAKIKHSNLKSYIFFNNTWGTAAIKNGLYLQENLG